MSRIAIIILGCLALLVLAVWVWVLLRFSGSWLSLPPGASPYAAVYLTNGSVYFEKLSWLGSDLVLADVWVLQQGTDAQGKPQLNIAPFQNALWTPVSEIWLNPQSVLYWTYVQSGSQLARMLQSP